MMHNRDCRLRRVTCAGTILLAIFLAASLAGNDAPVAKLEIQSLEAWPATIQLQHRFDRAQLLIIGRLSTGEQIDLTRTARLVTDPDVVRVTAEGQITPAVDGRQTLVFAVYDHQVEVPVEVSGIGAPYEISYVRDVNPVLSKLGCNAGTCHGAKDGQRGFKLSLRGYDFLFDHRALTDDLGGRRFNRANPDQSLMLLKASGTVPHVGGQLTVASERPYEVLRGWIQSGARLDLDAPRVTQIELLPKDPVLPRAELTQQMVVLATYSDGSVRDVTADAFIESGNIEVATANRQGLVTVLRRGEAPLLARYEGAYTATTVTVMGDRSGFVWNSPSVHNYIDGLVDDKLQRVKILPSELCRDEEFIRRIYLDLTGLPPTADQVRAFLADSRDTRVKRDEVVDHLVGSPEYIEHWTNKWADLLQVNRKFLGEIGAVALRKWIREAVASNRPYDQFVYEILTASGSNLDNPAAAYWKILRDPAMAMENTTHLFLAVRFNCNKCHDHPFERWTQDQYYHLTAYFARVGRKEDPNFAGQKIGGTAVEDAAPLVEVVFDADEGETTHERTGQVAQPAFPYEFAHATESSTTRREELARWLIAKENRYFATSYVNRLWGYLLGVGLIEPIDDIRAGNPPTNPQLLEALTQDFVDSGFDVQHMLRTICKSRVYQQSVQTNAWNEDDRINYSHALPRRLPAEVLFDAIHVAMGSTPKIPGVPAGTRAAELPDAGVSLPFLEDFGRPPRESACECERSSGIVLGPIMKLINGPTVNDAVSDSQSELAQLVAQQPNDEELVEEVFLRFLARRPTKQELELGVKSLAAARGDAQPQLQRQFEEYRDQLAKQQEAWEAQLIKPTRWTVLQPLSVESTAGAAFTSQEDGSILVSGPLSQDTYTIKVPSPLQRITGIRLEALADASLPEGGPGRAPNGNFVIHELQLSQHSGDALTPIQLQNAIASFSQDGWPVAALIDGNNDTGWAIMPRFNQRHWATLETVQPGELAESTPLVLTLVQQFADGQHNIGRFRLSITDSPRPFADSQLPGEIQELVDIDPSERTVDQAEQLTSYFLNLDPEYKRLFDTARLAAQQAEQYRLTGVQDLAWALVNTPAFLFNR